ncbi:MAG: hypothetical protein LUE86_08610, partial [Clostridiales bacterium]|nr:hypothetical protein [Clostridiales bacterium]
MVLWRLMVGGFCVFYARPAIFFIGNIFCRPWSVKSDESQYCANRSLCGQFQLSVPYIKMTNGNRDIVGSF